MRRGHARHLLKCAPPQLGCRAHATSTSQSSTHACYDQASHFSAPWACWSTVSLTAQALGLGLNDRDPLVRTASAWALGQLESPDSVAYHRERLGIEDDGSVREEIQRVLASSSERSR